MARAPAPECQRNNLVAPRCCTSGLHFDKDAINAAIGQTREAIATEDLAKIKSATESLEQASHAMSKAMYESAAAANAAKHGAESAESMGANPDAKGDDDAIDAEFEVKK